MEEILAKLEELAAKLEVVAAKNYEAGLAAGLAQCPTSEKVYTQAEYDAGIQAALEPVLAQVADLQAQLALVPEQIVAAKAELKAELKAAYEAQQVAESQAETGFADLLV